MSIAHSIPGGEIAVYQAADGAVRVEVRLERDTVWLTQAQMATLFGRERSVVTKHLRDVFREGELDEKSNVQNLHIAGSDRPVGYYNLDVIISVGYRVKSLQGNHFHIWATRVLRDHLVKGYTVNQQRLRDLNQAVRLVANTSARRDLSGDEAQALLAVIAQYRRTLALLDDYDHERISKPAAGGQVTHPLGYDEAMRIVARLRERFGTSAVFGVEKDQGLASALGALMQTFGANTPKTSRTESRRTRLIRMRARTPTSKTPASSTTRRWSRRVPSRTSRPLRTSSESLPVSKRRNRCRGRGESRCTDTTKTRHAGGFLRFRGGRLRLAPPRGCKTGKTQAE